MSEWVDSPRAMQVVAEAARLADDPSMLAEPQVAVWTDRVRTLSDNCAKSECGTYIAVLGTMMLAKAVNPRVDVFSVKARDNTPGSFGARRVASACLVPASRCHRFDIGGQGLEPLNNQPFFRAIRISRDLVVRERARPILNELVDLLHDLAQATSDEALLALAGFIHVRRQYSRTCSTADVVGERSGSAPASCFLSYARADSDFANHLADALLKAGIVCWQDIHDMRGGDFWRGQICDAIAKHDRLILICSRSSLERPAVVDEVLEAISLERQTGTQKLFPIRIDDFVLSSQIDLLSKTKILTGEWTENWINRLRAYHIPDFSNWSTPAQFQQEFQKLVDALSRQARSTLPVLPVRAMRRDPRSDGSEQPAV